jgi:hypothetical protein
MFLSFPGAQRMGRCVARRLKGDEMATAKKPAAKAAAKKKPAKKAAKKSAKK